MSLRTAWSYIVSSGQTGLYSEICLKQQQRQQQPQTNK